MKWFFIRNSFISAFIAADYQGPDRKWWHLIRTPRKVKPQQELVLYNVFHPWHSAGAIVPVKSIQSHSLTPFLMAPNRKLKRFFSLSVISKMCHYWCPSTTWTLKWYSSLWYQSSTHTLQTQVRWGGTVLATEESLGVSSFCFAEELTAVHEEECEGFSNKVREETKKARAWEGWGGPPV